MNRTSRWVALLIAGGCVGLSWDASACGNTMRGHQAEQRMRLIFDAEEEVITPRLQLAEAALREGKLLVAASELEAISARVREAHVRLHARYERAAALVTVRSGGQWPVQKANVENSAGARARLLEAAVTKLRKRLAGSPTDPVRLSDLGEALAALPKHHKEARNILEKLAARDLLTSAHGYAALSRLRSLAKDEAGAAQALNACRKLDEKGVACPPAAAPKA